MTEQIIMLSINQDSFVLDVLHAKYLKYLKYKAKYLSLKNK